MWTFRLDWPRPLILPISASQCEPPSSLCLVLRTLHSVTHNCSINIPSHQQCITIIFPLYLHYHLLFSFLLPRSRRTFIREKSDKRILVSELLFFMTIRQKMVALVRMVGSVGYIYWLGYFVYLVSCLALWTSSKLYNLLLGFSKCFPV
jgi:hypothetical protein